MNSPLPCPRRTVVHVVDAAGDDTGNATGICPSSDRKEECRVSRGSTWSSGVSGAGHPGPHRQLVGLRSRWAAIRTAWPWLRRSGDAADLGPNLEGLGPGGSILRGGHFMAAEQEERLSLCLTVFSSSLPSSVRPAARLRGFPRANPSVDRGFLRISSSRHRVPWMVSLRLPKSARTPAYAR